MTQATHLPAPPGAPGSTTSGAAARPAYQIANWSATYETSETRKLKQLRWVPVPNRHDGLAYRRLLAMPDGLSLFGAWVLLLEVASKVPRRGVLVDERGSALTPEDLCLITGASPEVFETALRVLSSPSIGWLEPVPPGDPGSSPGIPGCHPDAPGSDPAGPGSSPENLPLKGKEENGTELRNGLDAEELADRLYQRHPKKSGRILAEQALGGALAAVSDPVALAERIDQRHAEWCLFPDWQREGGRYAPKLADWLRTRGWEDDPPRANRDGELPEWRGFDND